MLGSCTTAKVAGRQTGRGMGCICVCVCGRCRLHGAARGACRSDGVFGPGMGDCESGDGICEMTGERQMGKSDDELRKDHTGRKRGRDGAKAESCEEGRQEVGTMQGDAQLTVAPCLPRPISSIPRVPTSRKRQQPWNRLPHRLLPVGLPLSPPTALRLRMCTNKYGWCSWAQQSVLSFVFRASPFGVGR